MELGKFAVYLGASTIVSIQLKVFKYFSSEKGLGKLVGAVLKNRISEYIGE